MSPDGTTDRLIVRSAARNTRYADAASIFCGAMIVTFLPVTATRVSNTNCLHVKPITHVTTSLSSVSGLNVTATGPVALWQLYSSSDSPAAEVSAAATEHHNN